MTKLLRKTIPESFESHGHKWVMRKWFHQNGKLIMCENGFHASEKILDAMSYVIPGWICMAKVKGESIYSDDKSVHSDMMIVERRKWTKEMSVELAIFAAELVLPIFEKEYPDDKRPANAIAAAKAYLRNPSSAAGEAAREAGEAAREAGEAAMEAAGEAARAAGEAAREAGEAAMEAAGEAARAAGEAARAAGEAAMEAAGEAAMEAARATILKKIEKKIKSLVGIR